MSMAWPVAWSLRSKASRSERTVTSPVLSHQSPCAISPETSRLVSPLRRSCHLFSHVCGSIHRNAPAHSDIPSSTRGGRALPGLSCALPLAKSRHARHSRGRRWAWCRAAPGTRNAGHQAVAGSDGFVAALAGADAHRFFEAGDEDLAVTDAPRLGSLLDRVDDRMDQVVGHDNLQFDLGDEVHDVSGAAVDLLLAAGPAEAFHLRHGHALDANFR